MNSKRFVRNSALLFAFLCLSFSAQAQGRRGMGERAEQRQAERARRQMRAGRTIFDRLDRMTPEQRKRLLERVPPERRERLQQRLEQYESMPPEQRENLRRQFAFFRQLPPEKQEAARGLFRQFRALPVDRRQELGRELQSLREMDEAARRERLDSPELKTRYSDSERQLLRDFSSVLAR